jgi:hypothetical protein
MSIYPSFQNGKFYRYYKLIFSCLYGSLFNAIKNHETLHVCVVGSLILMLINASTDVVRCVECERGGVRHTHSEHLGVFAVWNVNSTSTSNITDCL